MKHKKLVLILIIAVIVTLVIIPLLLQCTSTKSCESINGKTLAIPNSKFLDHVEYVYEIDSVFHIHKYETISDVKATAERPAKSYIKFIQNDDPFKIKLWSFLKKSKLSYVYWYETRTSISMSFSDNHKYVIQARNELDSITIWKIIKIFGR